MFQEFEAIIAFYTDLSQVPPPGYSSCHRQPFCSLHTSTCTSTLEVLLHLSLDVEHLDITDTSMTSGRNVDKHFTYVKIT